MTESKMSATHISKEYRVQDISPPKGIRDQIIYILGVYHFFEDRGYYDFSENLKNFRTPQIYPKPSLLPPALNNGRPLSLHWLHIAKHTLQSDEQSYLLQSLLFLNQRVLPIEVVDNDKDMFAMSLTKRTKMAYFSVQFNRTSVISLANGMWKGNIKCSKQFPPPSPKKLTKCSSLKTH